MRLPVLIPSIFLSTLLCASAAVSSFGQTSSEPGDKPEIMPPDKSAPMKMSPKPAAIAGPLKITYAGKSSEWTTDTLAALPHKTIQAYNAHTKTTQSYSGVALSDLLLKLGIPTDPATGLHGKDLRLYVTACGSDGYCAVLSIAEVIPAFHPGDVIVADALEGKPVSETGPLQLIVSEDKRPARWVHNLVAIRIQPAE